MEERLQKLMSQAGLGSRRDCEALIEAGRVTVNGRVIHLGDKADPATDTILVDGQPLQPAEQKMYVAIYKPRGVLSAVETPDPRPTVRDLVPIPGHIYPVGRLDVDSEGLMLLTNDGDLANRLTHPRYGHEKEYRVLVARRPDEEQLETWRRGVVLEDGYRTQPADVRMEGALGKGAWLRVILREGRKRQIRETGARIGLPVVKIIRVRLGSLTLGVLKPREWRFLTVQEIAALKGQPVAAAAQPAQRSQRRPGGPPPGGRPPKAASPGGKSSQEAPRGARRPGTAPGKRPGGPPAGGRPPFRPPSEEAGESAPGGSRRRFNPKPDAPPPRRSSRSGARSPQNENEPGDRLSGGYPRRPPGERPSGGRPSGGRPSGGRAGRPPARRGSPGKPARTGAGRPSARRPKPRRSQ